ncbi:hypothetical protein [Endozoicomonas lisbonensis]|uniref:AP2/ERF domain-containing protein n=1 Tax=Endozoicomonas lisbonensis TaxID=3120522 RepID=A0ABV2SPC7_9GAMM
MSELEPRLSINHQAQCVRVWEGGRHGKQTYFSAREHGSLYKAYLAARQYELSLPELQRLGRFKPRTRPTVRSASGIVGVCPFKNRKGEAAGWRASWMEDHHGRRRQRTRDYSFVTYGNRALSLAIACREMMAGLQASA